MKITIKNSNDIARCREIRKKLNIREFEIELSDSRLIADLKAVINFLLCTGCTVKFKYNSDSCTEEFEFNSTDNVRTAFWSRDWQQAKSAWSQINEIESNPNIKEEIIFSKIESQRQSNRLNAVTKMHQIKKSYNEVKDFVKRYASAYGIDLPYEEKLSTSDDYKPFYYKTKNWTPTRAQVNIMHAKIRASKRENASEWIDTYIQLKWYVENDIPFNEGYLKCAHCGAPVKIQTEDLTYTWNGEVLLLNDIECDCEICGNTNTANI